jgi:hypothetical protein
MTIETLLYHSGMSGMPSATLAAAGGLTALLDVCLVQGANLRTVTGITRTGDVANAVISGGNPFQIGEVVEIAGATPSAYNGRFRVVARDAGSISYDVAGTPATPASGTMTARHPPAGWTRQEFSTNVVAYRDGGALGHYMQVEDANPYSDAGASCRTRMAVGLTGLDTGTQLNAPHRIQKANGWVLVADARTCYVIMGSSNTFHFGEIGSYVAADAYAWHQSRGETAANGINIGGTFQVISRCSPIVGYNGDHQTAKVPIAALRAFDQLTPDQFMYPGGVGASFANCWTPQSVTLNTYPNPADGSVPLCPFLLWEGLLTCLRGWLRGVYFPVGLVPAGAFSNNVAWLDDVVIMGVTRRVAVVRYGVNGLGQLVFDLTGTWG